MPHGGGFIPHLGVVLYPGPGGDGGVGLEPSGRRVARGGGGWQQQICSSQRGGTQVNRLVGRYLRELGMPPLTLQEEGLTKGMSCPSHCPMLGAS